MELSSRPQNMLQKMFFVLLIAVHIEHVSSFTSNNSLLKKRFSTNPKLSSRQPMNSRVYVANSGIESAFEQVSSVAEFQPTALIILVAGALGILSQTLINSMLKGDQGLSAFLSDGKGYGNSKYKAASGESGRLSDDPLPWLKLPKLSFVDVAGQEVVNEEDVVKKLELLAQRGRDELEAGDKVKAAQTRDEINSLMVDNGFEDR